MLIHGVTYFRVVSITEDAAIDRLNTLCRGSAVYSHHRTHGLALPFGWTNGLPTKTFPCHDTLPATPTNSLSGLSHGWPHAYQRHLQPPWWQNGPKRGQGTIKTNGHTRLCLLTGPGYRTPITFPRWRHRQVARQRTESRPPPIR